jgi:16S rRNA (guanine966-N2)-methyltransferase
VSLARANLGICGAAEGYTIHRGDVATVLRQLPSDAMFDLVLLDPPYHDPVAAALEAAADRLAPDGLIVLERATRREPDVPARLERVRDVKSGDSTLTFFRRVRDG